MKHATMRCSPVQDQTRADTEPSSSGELTLAKIRWLLPISSMSSTEESSELSSVCSSCGGAACTRRPGSTWWSSSVSTLWSVSSTDICSARRNNTNLVGGLYSVVSVLQSYWSLYCSAFEHLCVYLGRSADFIPLGFILGFYVTQVVNRWWGQYNSIVWPDTLALNLISFMPGHQVRKSSLKLTNTYVVIVLENNW